MGTTPCSSRKSKYSKIIRTEIEKSINQKYTKDQMICLANKNIMQNNLDDLFIEHEHYLNLIQNDPQQVIKNDDNQPQQIRQIENNQSNSPTFKQNQEDNNLYQFDSENEQIDEQSQPNLTQRKVHPLTKQQIQISTKYLENLSIIKNQGTERPLYESISESPKIHIMKSNIRMTDLNKKLRNQEETILYECEVQNELDYRFQIKPESKIQVCNIQPPICDSMSIKSSLNECFGLDMEYNCYICSLKISEDFVVLNCYHNYHKRCFHEMIQNQITKNDFKIECKCGTKIFLQLLKEVAGEELFETILQLQCKQLETTYKNEEKYKNLIWQSK